MPNALPQNNSNQLSPNETLLLRYTGEDDQLYMVSDPDGFRLTVPKNRGVPEPFHDQPPHPLTPAYRLLALAFLGLAPAGLGALVLAPLAALWALAMLLTRPLSRGDRIRVIVVWGIAAGIVGIAIPMSALVLAHFHIKGRYP